MQNKRKNEGTLQNNKILKLDPNSSNPVKNFQITEKSKTIKKKLPKASAKSVGTRFSARLGNVQKINNTSNSETKLDNTPNSVAITSSLSASCLSSTKPNQPTISQLTQGSLNKTTKQIPSKNSTKTSIVGITVKTSNLTSNYKTSTLTSNTKTINSAPNNKSSNLNKTINIPINTKAVNPGQSSQAPNFINATSFYANYCPINENNVDKILLKSLTATFYLKMTLTSMRNELKAINKRGTLTRETNLKNQQGINNKLLKEYSAYKQSILSNIIIPRVLHNSIIQQATLNQTPKNTSAQKIIPKTQTKSDEVIEVSEDSGDESKK